MVGTYEGPEPLIGPQNSVYTARGSFFLLGEGSTPCIHLFMLVPDLVLIVPRKAGGGDLLRWG